jgi:hypothetical protein
MNGVIRSRIDMPLDAPSKTVNWLEKCEEETKATTRDGRKNHMELEPGAVEGEGYSYCMM